MSIDLDNPRPECADYARLLEVVTVERNGLAGELARVIKERDCLLDAARTHAEEALKRYGETSKEAAERDALLAKERDEAAAACKELDGIRKERDALAVDLDIERKECNAASARAEEAEEQLAFMRDRWSPFGGRSCSLCVYEDGVFKRNCKLHEWADANWTAGENDAAEAIAAQMQVRVDLIAEEVKTGQALFGQEPASDKEMRVLLEWIEILRTGAWRKEPDNDR